MSWLWLWLAYIATCFHVGKEEVYRKCTAYLIFCITLIATVTSTRNLGFSSLLFTIKGYKNILEPLVEGVREMLVSNTMNGNDDH